MGVESIQELVRIMRNHEDVHQRRWAREELEKRRVAARAAGRSESDDSLDFILGYATGVSLPSAMGVAGAILHNAVSSNDIYGGGGSSNHGGNDSGNDSGGDSGSFD